MENISLAMQNDSVNADSEIIQSVNELKETNRIVNALLIKLNEQS